MEKDIHEIREEFPKLEGNDKERSELVRLRYRILSETEDKEVRPEDILRVDRILRERISQGWKECIKVYKSLKDSGCLQGRKFYIEETVEPITQGILDWEWVWHYGNTNYSFPLILCIGNDTQPEELEKTYLDILGLDSEDDTCWSGDFVEPLRHKLPVCRVMKHLNGECKLTLSDISRIVDFNVKCNVEIENNIEED